MRKVFYLIFGGLAVLLGLGLGGAFIYSLITGDLERYGRRPFKALILPIGFVVVGFGMLKKGISGDFD